MMATDEQIKWLANQVYSVDSRKNDGQYKTIEQGTYYYNRRDKNLGQFKVLQVEDNHKNGMQAMAVASLDKNGNGTAIYAIL